MRTVVREANYILTSVRMATKFMDKIIKKMITACVEPRLEGDEPKLEGVESKLEGVESKLEEASPFSSPHLRKH